MLNHGIFFTVNKMWFGAAHHPSIHR